MKLAILYSGGKDSNYAAFLSKKQGHELVCLITIHSENPNSFMFHTPSIDKTKHQADAMGLPLLVAKTKGEKEKELVDLKNAIQKAIEQYNIEGIVTGALHSVYQASRIQKICDELDLTCVNPLWQKNQLDELKEIVREGFEVILIGIGAYPLDKSWLGRRIDERFISDMEKLQEKYKINVAGEGGEFESFVLWSPLFNKRLEVESFEDNGQENTWRRELKIKDG